jgi:O-antigen/teichoic acid export membrane protein
VGYIKETITGVSWVGGYRIANRLLTLVKTVILARLLLPVQFGIFGIATLALSFLEIVTETGINVFLVQEKSEIKEYLDTAWIVSIGRGILITIFLLLVSPLVAKFFNSPESLPVLLVISIVPFARGFLNPAEARFQKDLLFNKEFWFRLVCLILDSSVAIILALMTHSVFAMVWGLIAGVILELILSWLVLTPRPSLSFEWEKAKRIIDRGKWMTGASIFNYLFTNGDNMTVGKLLGEGPLGIYNVAYKISYLPISEISDVVSRVTFPVYTRISTDYERLKRAFLKTTLVTCLLITIAGIGIYVFAQQIVLIVLGPNWTAAIPVLKVLSIFGVVKGASFVPLSLFLAVNKQEYVTYVTLLGIAGLFIPIIPLTLKYGLIGTGYSVIIGSLVTLPLIIYYTLKIFRKMKYGH